MADDAERLLQPRPGQGTTRRSSPAPTSAGGRPATGAATWLYFDFSAFKQLDELLLYVSDRGIPLYVLIDEYDNFANTILAEQGADAYHSFTHGGGFYRNFFAMLKAGTAESGCIERLFVTGVSPVTMDDVTSGFNIGANLSLRPEFNEMLGFTEAEVQDMLSTMASCATCSPSGAG